jgi:VWFA-related protein
MKRAAIYGLLMLGLLPIRGIPQNRPQFTLRTDTDLVLVNVTVRDGQGNFVRDLKLEDFALVEDGKAQKLLSLDVENTDALVASEPQVQGLLENLNAPATDRPQSVPEGTFRNRRLVVLFFDLSSMQPEEIRRAANSAEDYVQKHMNPADLIAVVTLGNTLTVNQDFTADRDQLLTAIRAFNPESGRGLEAGATADTADSTDEAFTGDETEFNIFNTDRRLEALRSLAGALGQIEQKKSILYFTSGLQRTGIENQSQLRAATNAAVRANVSIYTIDVRGLQALPPGGDASRGSQFGTGTFSGQAVQNQFDSTFSSQETLVTLASDTGGRAFLDMNDFRPAFTRMIEDTSMYYVLGYRSSNETRDGRFRKITVTLKRRDVKVEHRRGYYAPADFQHSTKEDRERIIQEQLASDLPSTDLPVYLSTGYFRLSSVRYFVPVSVVVPGAVIPFTRAGDEDRSTLDVAGFVRDKAQRPFGNIRDTVKLAVDTARDVKRKNVQYDSGFFLPPGNYFLKVVVRENQTGQMGSFETEVVVPNLKDAPVKISSVVPSSQKQAARQRRDNPLVRNGSELIPSVTHVFSRNQQLYLYFEVYDPASAPDADPKNKNSIHMLTSAAFYKGDTKVYETPITEATELNARDRRASTFELTLALTQLPPGFYTCQVNVVDDAAGHFIFPRLALLVR